MPIIKEDEHGLYVNGGNWKSREAIPNTSQFKVGDEVKTHHFGGTIRVGVGKDEHCLRGQYLEYWLTAGLDITEEISHEEEAEVIQWYREHWKNGCKFDWS